MFTPIAWADWALKTLDVLAKLKKGMTVCDPTAGIGNFVIALVRQYLTSELFISRQVLQQIFLIEKESRFLVQFRENFYQEFGLDFPEENIFCQDIIQTPPQIRFDVLIGNPPWANFSDLTEDLKSVIKSFYVKVGLVDNLKEVLLGRSRIDLAALVTYAVLSNNAKQNSQIGFFLPISLFLNDGASESFRKYHIQDRDFALEVLYDFDGLAIFEKVSTRFCFAIFTMSKKTKYPINYFTLKDQQWKGFFAAPIVDSQSSLIVKSDSKKSSFDIKKIDLESWQQPRQGVNTCGANDIFIVSEKPDAIPVTYIYPLVTTNLLQGKVSSPEKWIILPYHKTGKALSLDELESTGLLVYFSQYQERLSARKGVLINASIKRGIWWGLIGIGPYSFAPFKLIWSSLGSKEFSPRILSHWEAQTWQANQAMQAFIPCKTFADAERIQTEMKSSGIEQHLKDQKMEGTMNWAQPGRIKKFVRLGEGSKRLV